MLLKFKKDYGVEGGNLYFSGQVVQIKDEQLAQKLIDDKVAVVAGLTDKESKPVTPQTDPDLIVTPHATGKAAAMVARDNAIIDAKLKQKQEFREEAESKEPVLDYEIRAAEAAKKETEALNIAEENAKPKDEKFEATLDYEIRAEVAARKETITATHEEAEALRQAEEAEAVPFKGAYESDNNEIMSTDEVPVKVSKVAKVKAVKAPKVAKAKSKG